MVTSIIILTFANDIIFVFLNYLHMKKEIIDQLYKAFEQYALEVNGVECWSARELQKLLGYSLWQNFTKVIEKAKVGCD